MSIIPKNCEICGKRATIFLTNAVKGNSRKFGFCSNCDSSDEASEMVNGWIRSVEPTEMFRRQQAKPKVYVVMEREIDPEYMGRDGDMPIAAFKDANFAKEYVRALKEEGYLHKTWTIDAVPLEIYDPE